MTTKKENRRSRRTPAALACAALLGAVLVGAPRPSEAALLPVAVTAAVSFLQSAYSYYKQLQSLLGTSSSAPGPDLAQLIRQVRDSVIAEMRSERNLALQSQTRTVFNLFANLADNAPSDPTNAAAWSDILGRQQSTADAMFDIIMSTNDSESSYQLAPAYNTLIASGTGLLKIKGQLWPSTPSSWNDYFVWLQAGINANYKMVGSQRHQCYPGYNPGYRPPQSEAGNIPQWLATTSAGKYRDSLLWSQKIANKYYTVATFPCGARLCNPGTKFCYTSGTVCSGGGPATNACNYQLSDLDCAAALAKPAFDNNGVVKIIRAGMIGIQTVSGGNDYDWATNDPLTTEGKLVDPWVDEPSCGNGPWAYAQMP